MRYPPTRYNVCDVGLEELSGVPGKTQTQTNISDPTCFSGTSLSSISGGVAYLPLHLEELPEICRGIAKDIRNRYSIGYVPLRVDDKSSLRTIKVSITDAGSQRFVVHARTNYLLPTRP